MSDPIHNWFGLSYANYLVLQRSLLQSMPEEWQERFVKCLRQLNEVRPPDLPGTFVVLTKNPTGGRFVSDPYADYQRGRRRVELKNPI